MIDAFLEAREYIDNIPKFVKKNGMEDTKAFYERLSCPCLTKKVIHVAGTNGKGSVCAYLQSVLREAGYQVGLFTSPHLVDIRERIRMDEELISGEEFAQVFKQVKDKCSEEYHPSYFEYLYFMAMLYFEKKDPDIIILETGLGGRLDATNSFPSPCICIITEIGLDHTEYLGETLSKIAAEKAGIVKKGIPLVYFAKNKTVSDVFEKTAKKAETRAFSVKPEEICLKKYDEKGIDFSYHSGYYKCSTFHLTTAALYQQENAVLCIKALGVLKESGAVKVSEENLLEGLQKARWEGRMEEILPDVWLDGAHNPDGIAAFLQSVWAAAEQDKKGNKGASGEKRILLYSALAEKACGEMAGKIGEAELFQEIVVTRIAGNRAEEPGKLKELFGGREAAVIENVEEAFRYCLRRREAGWKVYIAGSLYLAGQIKPLAEREKDRS